MSKLPLKLHEHTTPNPVMLIDGSPLLYINGNRPNYKECIDSFMMEFAGTCRTTRYIGFIDNGKSFRTQIDPSYKVMRPSKDSLLDKYPFLYRVKDYLVEEYKFNLVDGLEGDDAIAIVNRKLNYPYYVSLAKNKDGKRGQQGSLVSNNDVSERIYRTTFNSVMISIDKDFLQLPGVHLNIKSRKTHVVYPSNSYLTINEEGKFSGTGYLLMYAQCMMGDSADNIKGLVGYGPVKSYNLLKTATNEEEAHRIVFEEYKKVYCGSTDDPQAELDKTLSLVQLIQQKEDYATPPIETLSIRGEDENI